MPQDELIELLEMRVTRLERIVAGQGSRAGDHQALKAPAAYGMDDPRLILFGAYAAETTKEGMAARWFGQDGQVQMVFPHGRGCWQTAQLLMRPFKDVDLRAIRIIIDEARIVPKLTRVATPQNAVLMEFRLPPAHAFQTEIQMHGIPVKSPKEHASSKDARMLSFLLFSANFVPDTTEEGALPA